MKKLLVTSIVLATSIACFAQQTEPIQKTFRQDPVSHPMFPTFLVTLFGVIVGVLLIVVGAYLVHMIRFMKKQIHPIHKVTGRPVVKVIRPHQKSLSGIQTAD